MTQLTEVQIEALAPDESARHAGRGLATGAQWLFCARSERAIWGEMQGSGKKPYQTQVDLATLEVAFKCSCPSRKFPCKHGLGLLLVYAKQPNIFDPKPEPDWVQTWLDQRQAKQTDKVEKAEVQAETTPENDAEADKKAQDKAKRNQTKLDQAQNGIAELSLWLSDLIHGGLLALPHKEHAYFEQIALRMVDAKIPAMAFMVRKLQKINYLDTNEWHAEALKIVGNIALIVTVFERLDTLPPLLQTEVRNQIGFTTQKADVLADPNALALQDHWLVISRTLLTSESDPTLMEQRILLYGITTQRFALLLDHGFRGAPNTPELVTFEVGAVVTATLVFYPSALPYRALVKQVQAADLNLPQAIVALPDFAAAHKNFVGAKNQNPFLDAVQQCVENVAVTSENMTWILRDAAGFRMAIHRSVAVETVYQLLALTGGAPTTIFLTRHDGHAIPHGIVLGKRFLTLTA